jgi:hypothetical protein
MHRLYQQLQREYVEALRAVAPEVVAWWDAHCPVRWTEPIPPDAMTDFHRRWLVGPAAHPRIIAVFRKYFLAADELNDRLADEESDDGDKDAAVWGKDVEEESVSFVLPIDLLVNDLAVIAPDLHEIMQGMVFIPVGSDPEGEVS